MRHAPSRLVAFAGLVAFAAACGPKRDDEKNAAPRDERPPVDDRGGPVPDAGELFGAQDGALTNLPQILDALALAPVHARGHRGQGLTIAVLDNGFVGLSQSLGTRLPPGLTVESAPRAEMAQTTHGTRMAEIAYAVATGRASYSPSVAGPRLLLLNSNGFTNFKAAVDRVVQEKPDLVLYAQVWEYGGNGDGGGFINREVDRAVAAGALWVNASGNMAQATWAGPVRIGEGGAVELPHDGRYVRFAVPADGTAVKIVLSWNDFDASKDYKTPQDLDLIVEDESGRELAAGRLVQDGSESAGRDDKTSAHAREIAQARLPAGVYRLRVEARSRNFDAGSRLRLTVDGHRVTLLDQTPDDSLLIPADNPRVLAVAASDTTTSGRKAGAGKAEIAVPSRVAFESGAAHTGTSAAAAIAVGTLAALRSAYGPLTRADVVDLAARRSIAVPQASCSTGRECPPVLRLDVRSLLIAD